MIASKAGKLQDYRHAVGMDVRLLIVANGRFNSGKLRPDSNMHVDKMGFEKVYFFDWPGGKMLILA